MKPTLSIIIVAYFMLEKNQTKPGKTLRSLYWYYFRCLLPGKKGEFVCTTRLINYTDLYLWRFFKNNNFAFMQNVPSNVVKTLREIYFTNICANLWPSSQSQHMYCNKKKSDTSLRHKNNQKCKIGFINNIKNSNSKYH